MNQSLTAINKLLPGRLRFIYKYGIFFILALYFMLGLAFDFTVPLFEKPDELKHFAVIQFIQTHNRLPVVEAGVYKTWDQEGTQPPLYHILAAVVTSRLNLSSFKEPPRNPHYADDRSFVWRERGNNNLYLHSLDESWNISPILMAAKISRWLSLVAGAITIFLTYWLAQIIFVHNRAKGKSQKNQLTGDTCHVPLVNSLPLVAASLVAFLPQFLHVSSAVTNDSVSVTIAAAILVVLALITNNGLSLRYAIFLGILLGLGAITKLSLLYLTLPAGLVFLYNLYRERSVVRLLKYGTVTGGLMLLLSGWWFWRNWQLYGDISALNAHLLYRGGVLNPQPTLAQIWQTEMVGLELSFWAAFGAGQVLLHPWIYTLLGGVKYSVLLGVLLGVWQIFSRQKENRLLSAVNHATFIILVLLTFWIFIIFAALFRWMQITPASWGRLLYPALPALAVLSAWAFSILASYMVQFALYLSQFKYGLTSLGCILAHAFQWLVPLALFVLAVFSSLYYTPAAYAKTSLVSEKDLPQNINRLNFTYGDEVLRLIGYRVEADAIHPGEWLPVTLYWQATAPISKNYSAFVHLLDQNGDSIGQANTYPDGGKWPTSMLEPGLVLQDTYHIFVPPNTNLPVFTRLAMGIFEFDDPLRAAKIARNRAGETVEPIVDGLPLVPYSWPQLNPVNPQGANFENQIRLIGTEAINKKAKPGAVVPLTLYWETLQPPGQNLNLFIHLIDTTTQTQIAGFDGPPPFPTRFWQTGNTFIDTRQLPLPSDLPPGNYSVTIGWYSLDNFARLHLVDSEAGGDALPLFNISVE